MTPGLRRFLKYSSEVVRKTDSPHFSQAASLIFLSREILGHYYAEYASRLQRPIDERRYCRNKRQRYRWSLSEGTPLLSGHGSPLQDGVKAGDQWQSALQMISALKVLKNSAKQILIGIPPVPDQEGETRAILYIGTHLLHPPHFCGTSQHRGLLGVPEAD